MIILVLSEHFKKIVQEWLTDRGSNQLLVRISSMRIKDGQPYISLYYYDSPTFTIRFYHDLCVLTDGYKDYARKYTYDDPAFPDNLEAVVLNILNGNVTRGSESGIM